VDALYTFSGYVAINAAMTPFCTTYYGDILYSHIEYKPPTTSPRVNTVLPTYDIIANIIFTTMIIVIFSPSYRRKVLDFFGFLLHIVVVIRNSVQLTSCAAEVQNNYYDPHTQNSLYSRRYKV